MFSTEIYCSRLRELRAEQNLSAQVVADRLSVPRSTFTHWELGDREPPYATLCAIADLYGVTTDYLLGRTDER